ncbi:type II toxin-antitoxin system VapC family toxin [Aureimonas mangrovi]|uniref:type II toxin-antitoxin system VapC family toxin n=1 Tax=Aureimonas mangrovi TaxID=2758041 RepID=UPI00163D5A71|nr:type II toxin-antitoxin system VapC family toxin [Aureimonas mangrovi]
MFIDASAICASLLGEPDGDGFYHAIATAPDARTSAMALWESALAVARVDKISPSEALSAVNRFVAAAEIEVVSVPPETAALAFEAFERFGKGRHPAGLNFGDCFAYACARHFGVPLLYKGEDFAHTDIPTVRIAD